MIEDVDEEASQLNRGKANRDINDIELKKAMQERQRSSDLGISSKHRRL
jgi:hypothetical protein